jgi:hypothetical protein
MGMVENDRITNAMIAFRQAVDDSLAPDELRSKSLALSHACRAEMADSWSPIWRRTGG